MEDKNFQTASLEAQDKQMLRIMELLHWDEMQYKQFQYECGRAYLHWYLPTDEDARYQLERSKIYWNWFKTLWNAHDMAYVETFNLDKVNLKYRRELYSSLHDPQALVIEYKPNNIVLKEIKAKRYVHTH